MFEPQAIEQHRPTILRYATPFFVVVQAAAGWYCVTTASEDTATDPEYYEDNRQCSLCFVTEGT
ncbi:hypothetical protein EW026_g5120 [Hermanssonia centrifuga]|uniref:Uncharacterized protein n=1 Tax=Hermanssonia centrifuga TaxID=98765 RepID=A0A4V3XA53_9APHY|nr:hypothetical protein EW026_g5120 [Hermanssonia centrifuga]